MRAVSKATCISPSPAIRHALLAASIALGLIAAPSAA